MFYSHDLLGRKTPLGAIWTLAHGRKLSKGRIISINLKEICEEILQPGVPHSLRLQGILIGGVVIVYNKQQAYLLEDLQDMMRRVKAAGSQPASSKVFDGAAAAAVGTKGLKKKKDRTTANLGEITVMDMDDLTGADIFNESAGDFLGLMGPLISYSSGSERDRGGHLKNSQHLIEAPEVGGDLFTMPSIDGESSELTGTTSNATTQGGHKASRSKSRSRSVTFATDEQLEQQHPYEPAEEEVYGGLGPNAEWNPDEEMFDLNFDLLEGLDIPGAATSNKATSDADAVGPTQAASDAQHPTSSTSNINMQGDQFELDEQLQTADTDEQLLGQRPFEAGAADEAGARDQGTGEDTELERDVPASDGEKRAPTRAKSKKRRADQAFVDDLENVQIRSSVYRDWMADASPLVDQDLKKKSTASAVVLASSADLLNPSKLLTASTLMPAGVASLCPELLELYRAPVELLQASGDNKHRGVGLPPGSPEVNNSTGMELPRAQQVHRQALPLEQVPGPTTSALDAEEEEVEGGMVPPEHTEERDMLSNDEAHDQLMDLPFAGDIEVERLRAATTPNSGSLNTSSPGGTAARMLQSVGKRAASSTSNDSMLRPMQLDDEVQSGAAVLRGALRSSRAGSEDLDDREGMFYGAGNLADLLPDVDNMPADEEVPMQSPAAAQGSPGTSSDRPNSSQFPLLEETEPSQPTQAPTQLQESGIITHASKFVLSVFRSRLQQAEQQLQEEHADDMKERDGVAAPSISMFGLMREGRLSRAEAAKLFYQVCVTSSVGYIHAHQDRPFADIRIFAGPSL